jgi:hypothetical protein
MVNQRKAALSLSVFLAVFFVLWTLRATLFYAINFAREHPPRA